MMCTKVSWSGGRVIWYSACSPVCTVSQKFSLTSVVCSPYSFSQSSVQGFCNALRAAVISCTFHLHYILPWLASPGCWYEIKPEPSLRHNIHYVSMSRRWVFLRAMIAAPSYVLIHDSMDLLRVKRHYVGLWSCLGRIGQQHTSVWWFYVLVKGCS